MRMQGRRGVASSSTPSECAELKTSEVTVLFAHLGGQEAFASMRAQCYERECALVRFRATRSVVEDVLRTKGLALSSSCQTLWPAQVGAHVHRLDSK